MSPDHPEAWDPTGNPSTDLAHPHPTGGDHWNDRGGYHKLTQRLWLVKQRLPLGFASSAVTPPGAPPYAQGRSVT